LRFAPLHGKIVDKDPVIPEENRIRRKIRVEEVAMRKFVLTTKEVKALLAGPLEQN